MILQRIAKGLRQQDWVTVFVEFALVVVGVLVALQLEDWARYAENREKEKFYLNWLDQSLTDSIRNSQGAVASLKNYQETVDYAVQHLRACDLTSDDDLAEFERRFLTIGPYARATFIDSALKELNRAGIADIISSLELREALALFETINAVQEESISNMIDVLEVALADLLDSYDMDKPGDAPKLLTPYRELCNNQQLTRLLNRYGLGYYAMWQISSGKVKLMQDLQAKVRDLGGLDR